MGNKNSGRRPLGWYRDLNYLLDASFDIVMKVLNDEIPAEDKLSWKDKAELASRFLIKRVGEKIDLTIEHTLNPVQLADIKAKILEAKQKAKEIEYKPIDP